MTVSEKIAYIKGLMEGVNFQPDTAEKKILLNIVEALDLIADSLADLQEETEELDDFVDELDNDLGALEDLIYDDEDEDGDSCECCGECDFPDDDDNYEIDCPKCGDKICFCDCDDPSDLLCPGCGEHIDCAELYDEDEDIDGDEIDGDGEAKDN